MSKVNWIENYNIFSVEWERVHIWGKLRNRENLLSANSYILQTIVINHVSARLFHFPSLSHSYSISVHFEAKLRLTSFIRLTSWYCSWCFHWFFRFNVFLLQSFSSRLWLIGTLESKRKATILLLFYSSLKRKHVIFQGMNDCFASRDLKKLKLQINVSIKLSKFLRFFNIQAFHEANLNSQRDITEILTHNKL